MRATRRYYRAQLAFPILSTCISFYAESIPYYKTLHGHELLHNL